MAHQAARLNIRLYGSFSLWWSDGAEIDLRSAKAQALMALLATAPDGKRTRSWLQEILWGRSGETHGRASLRQALSALRRILGPAAESIFLITQQTIRLRTDCLVLVGSPTDGELLEGIDIREDGFEDWLRAQRAAVSDAAEGTDGTSSKPAPIPLTTVPKGGAPAPFSGLLQPSPADVQKPLPPRSDRLRPVVAVMPFAGMDTVGQGSHLGDAIAQDVTRSLSRSPFLQVISHLSARSESLRSADLSQVKSLLGVDYVVYGHVRLSGETFRLDVDFVDMATSELRWTREYSVKLADFLGGGDGVVQDVADAINSAIFNEALAPLAYQSVRDIDTHRLLMAGITLIHRLALGSFAKGRECLEEVIRREPNHAIPRAWLARWYILSVKQGWTIDAKQDIEKAYAAGEEALDRNPTCPFSLAMSGFVRHHLWNFDEAFARHEEALSHDPNHAIAWLLTGVLFSFMGDGANAVENTEKARFLSPLDPNRYFFDSITAGAHAVHGNYGEALRLTERSLKAHPRYASTLRVRTYALEMVGRHEEAKSTAEQILKYDPDFTVQKYLKTNPGSMSNIAESYGKALRAAGIPDR
ncbi:MAG: hypothetical protein AAGB11_07150 [Pseudomonadota bacterium]